MHRHHFHQLGGFSFFQSVVILLWHHNVDTMWCNVCIRGACFYVFV